MAYEFENEVASKIHALTDSTCAMLAGDMLYVDQSVQLVETSLFEGTGQQHAGYQRGNSQEFVQVIPTVIYRRQKSGTTWIDVRIILWMPSNAEPWSPSITVDQAMATETIGVQLIVVARTETGFGIYIMANAGLSTCVDAIGFTAIGSGSPHVHYSLLGAKYKKSLGKTEVEELVKQAKAVTEVAQGVGKVTSFALMEASEEENNVTAQFRRRLISNDAKIRNGMLDRTEYYDLNPYRAAQSVSHAYSPN